MSERTYARFYYAEFIRDYPDAWADERVLGTWLKLFVRAEQMWPLPCELPRSIRPRPLAVLVEMGLIATDGTVYAVKGMAAERERRSNAGKAGAAKRWHSEGNANAMPSSRRAEAEDEITPPPSPAKGRSNGTNPRATGTNPRALGTSPRQEREAQKRGPSSLHQILAAAAKGEKA